MPSSQQRTTNRRVDVKRLRQAHWRQGQGTKTTLYTYIYIIFYNYIVYNIYIYIYTYILYELHWLSSCIVLDVRLCKIWIECVLKRFEIFNQIKSVFSHCLALLMIPDPELSRFMHVHACRGHLAENSPIVCQVRRKLERSSLCQHAGGQTRQRQDWDWELHWPAKLIKMNQGSQTCLFKKMTGVVMICNDDYVILESKLSTYQHINISLVTVMRCTIRTKIQMLWNMHRMISKS